MGLIQRQRIKHCQPRTLLRLRGAAGASRRRANRVSYGTTEFGIRDPDGYVLAFASR
jgi:hypothetical protein